jgi:regulator of RNase E activity RraA
MDVVAVHGGVFTIHFFSDNDFLFEEMLQCFDGTVVVFDAWGER